MADKDKWHKDPKTGKWQVRPTPTEAYRDPTAFDGQPPAEGGSAGGARTLGAIAREGGVTQGKEVDYGSMSDAEFEKVLAGMRSPIAAQAARQARKKATAKKQGEALK